MEFAFCHLSKAQPNTRPKQITANQLGVFVINVTISFRKKLRPLVFGQMIALLTILPGQLLTGRLRNPLFGSTEVDQDVLLPLFAPTAHSVFIAIPVAVQPVMAPEEALQFSDDAFHVCGILLAELNPEIN